MQGTVPKSPASLVCSSPPTYHNLSVPPDDRFCHVNHFSPPLPHSLESVCPLWSSILHFDALRVDRSLSIRTVQPRRTLTIAFLSQHCPNSLQHAFVLPLHSCLGEHRDRSRHERRLPEPPRLHDSYTLLGPLSRLHSLLGRHGHNAGLLWRSIKHIVMVYSEVP